MVGELLVNLIDGGLGRGQRSIRVADALPNGDRLTVDGQTLFIEFARGMGLLIGILAGLGQGLLERDPLAKNLLQGALGQCLFGRLEFLLGLRLPLLGLGHAALEFLGCANQSLLTSLLGSLGETVLLQAGLHGSQTLLSRLALLLGLCRSLLGRCHRRLQGLTLSIGLRLRLLNLGDGLLDRLKFGLRGIDGLLKASGLGFKPLGLFLKTNLHEAQLMTTGCGLGERGPTGLQTTTSLLHSGLQARELILGRRGCQLGNPKRFHQPFNPITLRQQTRSVGGGLTMQTKVMGTDHVTGLRDKGLMRLQLPALGDGLLQGVGQQHLAEPVTRHAGGLTLALNFGGQSIRPNCGILSG